MKKIFNSTIKSFKLIKFVDKSNTVIPTIGYTLRPQKTVFFPIVRNTTEVIESAKKLLGPKGLVRSFLRYYFPKKVFYTASLFPKPRQIVVVDETEKRETVKKEIPGFKGIPKNKITDNRNLILDFSMVLNMIIPNDKSILSRPKVVQYIESVLPEVICYILFKSHDKKALLEDDISIESMKQTIEENNSIEYYDNCDIDEPVVPEFDENMFSSEHFSMLKETFELDVDDIRSVEKWEEYLLKNLKMVSMGGPVTGFNEIGFDSFIISIPLTLKTIKFYTNEIITGKVKLKRNTVLINPDLVYEVSFIRFLYQMYEHYFDGTDYGNEFMKEIMKHKVVFHLHTEELEFVIDFEECKDVFKYNPTRFLNMLKNRLKILTLRHINALEEKDIDSMLEEAEETELKDIETVVANKTELSSDTIKRFNDNFSKIVTQDKKLQDVIKNINNKSEEPLIIKESEKNIDIDPPTQENDIINTKFEFTDKEISDLLSDNEEIDTSEEDDMIGYTNIEDIRKEEEPPTLKSNDDEEYGEFQEPIGILILEDEEEEAEKGSKDPIIPFSNTIARTPKELKRIEELKEKYKSITVHDQNIQDIIDSGKDTTIEKRESFIKENVRDSSTKKMNMMDYQNSYLKKNYQADIINCVKSLSINKIKPAYIVSAETKDSSTQFTQKETYKFVLKDEDGKRHTLTFDIPKIDENGFVTINGNKKIIKKQILRLPIVKISKDQVYITTQYNNVCIERSGLILNRGAAIMRKLFNEYFENNSHVEVQRGSGIDGNKDYLTTLEYDSIANMYFGLEINKHSEYGSHIGFYFDQSHIRKIIAEQGLKFEHMKEDGTISNKVLPIGINYTEKSIYYIMIDKNASVSGTIISILSKTLHDEKFIPYIKTIKTPKTRTSTKINVQSRKVPLIAFINYLFGWDKVKTYLTESKVEFKEKRDLSSNDLYIKFKDGFLYYTQFPIQNSLLLNGLSELDTENYNYSDLSHQDIYLDFMQKKFSTKNLAKGWVGIKEMLIDPVTYQILEDLKLPTDLLEVLLYCNELLGDNSVLSESDARNYRIRSHELITECIYRIICEQYNTYRKRNGKNITMSVPMNAVMGKLNESQIMDGYDCLSPVGEMKYLSLTTFKGPGGTKLDQAFNLEKRAFNKSFIGLFGITSPEGGATGVVKELSQNPKIVSTRGFISDVTPENTKMKLADIATVEEALVPYCNQVDDPNRIAFVGSQSKHIMGISNASMPIVRTGVEKTIGYQVGDTFAYKAKQDGIVTEIDEINKKVFITHKDGTKDVIDYNNKLIKNSDMFIENSYIVNVKPGQKVSKYDIIVADSRFFKKDIMGGLVYTQGRNAMVAVLEGSYNEEDSSMLNEEFGEMLSTNISKRKQIVIEPTNTIIEYKKVGDFVKQGDPLFIFDNSEIFEDGGGEFDDIFKEIDTDTLSEMIHQTPRSNFTGRIVEMNVYWTVPVEKMSPSVKTFVNSYIKKIKKEIKSEEEFTGKESKRRIFTQQAIPDRRGADGTMLIHGVKIPREGGILIEYMISTHMGSGVADKLSLHSSLKTEPSLVVPKELAFYRENGKLDITLSLLSINARMINSIFPTSCIGLVLHTMSKRISKEFLDSIK